jgi:hypothetical protein
VDDNRIVVTINARDFVRLAGQKALHGGLATFPSGSRPHEQLALILRASAISKRSVRRVANRMNRRLDISHGGAIRVIDLPSAPQ